MSRLSRIVLDLIEKRGNKKLLSILNVEELVATGRYASKSEFFRSLLRMWMEGRLADELEKSRGELKTGKGKLLRSLTDLR